MKTVMIVLLMSFGASNAFAGGPTPTQTQLACTEKQKETCEAKGMGYKTQNGSCVCMPKKLGESGSQPI